MEERERMEEHVPNEKSIKNDGEESIKSDEEESITIAQERLF